MPDGTSFSDVTCQQGYSGSQRQAKAPFQRTHNRTPVRGLSTANIHPFLVNYIKLSNKNQGSGPAVRALREIRPALDARMTCGVPRPAYSRCMLTASFFTSRLQKSSKACRLFCSMLMLSPPFSGRVCFPLYPYYKRLLIRGGGLCCFLFYFLCNSPHGTVLLFQIGGS